MKKVYCFIVFLILVCLLTVSAAFSQKTGILEGRLVNGTDAAIVPGGVTLEIIGFSGGMSILRTAESDREGKFRIENLPLESMLMLRAVYLDANYNKQFQFDDSGRAFIELEVFETTSSANDIHLEEYVIVFQAVGNHLQSVDSVKFVNETDPPRTFMRPDGNFRFSKAPAILEPPQMRIAAPGSSMPIIQSALESPDGELYYSLYPLRPGGTVVDILQILPYDGRNYTYIKKFYHAVSSIEIEVMPADMELSGTGLTRIDIGPDSNTALYRSAPIEAGVEVEWVFSGGTPLAEQPSSPAAGGGSRIESVPDSVGRNAATILPLLLMGFVLVLWYAFNRAGK